MKRFVVNLSVFVLFLFFSTLMLGCGGTMGRNATFEGGNTEGLKNNTTSSETGVTQTEEVPFAEETVVKIKECESQQEPLVPEQRVIPFQEMPPPKELPESKSLELENKSKNLALHNPRNSSEERKNHGTQK